MDIATVFNLRKLSCSKTNPADLKIVAASPEITAMRSER
jgi:hypothetical protein